MTRKILQYKLQLSHKQEIENKCLVVNAVKQTFDSIARELLDYSITV